MTKAKARILDSWRDSIGTPGLRYLFLSLHAKKVASLAANTVYDTGPLTQVDYQADVRFLGGVDQSSARLRRERIT